MNYTCQFLFSYADMESTYRLMYGETEIDSIDASTLLNSKDERITELEKEVKGYQVALSLPSNNEAAYNLRQQAKGLEDYVSKAMDNAYILHLDVSNPYHAFLINLNATALRLNKHADELEQGE